MNDEQALLRVIAADPDDVTACLVYADWLEERCDPRAAVWRRGLPLASVLARPDDDAARAAYADWAGASGDPDRAEFVRTQMELSRNRELQAKDLSPEGGLYKYSDFKRKLLLQGREQDLLTANFWKWLPEPLTEPWFLGRPMDTALRFRHGFVEEVSCRLIDFILHGQRLREATPLRTVTLTALLRGNDPLPEGMEAEVWPEGGAYAVVAQLGWAERRFPGIRFLTDPAVLPPGYGCGTTDGRIKSGHIVCRRLGDNEGMVRVAGYHNDQPLIGGLEHCVGVAINYADPGQAVVYRTSTIVCSDRRINIDRDPKLANSERVQSLDFQRDIVLDRVVRGLRIPYPPLRCPPFLDRSYLTKGETNEGERKG